MTGDKIELRQPENLIRKNILYLRQNGVYEFNGKTSENLTEVISPEETKEISMVICDRLMSAEDVAIIYGVNVHE